MSWKHWRVLDSETVHTSNDTTYRVKLPNSNILHSLLVKAKCTNGSTSAQNQSMADVIDSVKIIADGSHVLFHAEVETIRMLSLLNKMGNLRQVQDEQASAVQEVWLPIPFGRSFYDENFWLDLSRFTDVELQIKYSPTIAVTSFTTGTFTSTVLGLMSLDGAPSTYHGSLVTRIIENFTTAASGDKVVNPPQRYPYRFLAVRCYEAAIADAVDITDIKFDLNNEQRTPVKMKWSELSGLNDLLSPLEVDQKRIIFREDNDTVNTLLSAIRSAVLQQITATSPTNDTFELCSIDAIAGDQLTLDMAQADVTAGAETYTAYTTDTAFWLLVSAQGLPFAVYIPLNEVDEPPYFDPTVWDEITLTLTQGAAGGDTDVVLQEVATF